MISVGNLNTFNRLSNFIYFIFLCKENASFIPTLKFFRETINGFLFWCIFKSKEKIETVVANHCMLSVTLGLRNPFSRQIGLLSYIFRVVGKNSRSFLFGLLGVLLLTLGPFLMLNEIKLKCLHFCRLALVQFKTLKLVLHMFSLRKNHWCIKKSLVRTM